MNLKTLEQARGEYAYDFIETVSGLKDMSRDELIQTLTEMILPDFTDEKFYRDFIEVMGDQVTPSDFGRKVEEKLSTLISKTPVMVLTNGLGQTMAFFASKAGGRPFELKSIIKKFMEDKDELDIRAPELKLQLENGSEYERRNAGRELKQLEIKVKKSANAVKSLLLSPSNTAHLLLYASIQEWLHRRKVVPESEEFLEWFTTTGSLTLNHATKETLELLKWMKRFSDAMLEGGEGE